MPRKNIRKYAILRPGQRTYEAGLYEQIGPRGGRTGIRRTMQMGAKLPPTQRPGEGYIRLDAKTILTDIAKQ